jgi:hypothetical protein
MYDDSYNFVAWFEEFDNRGLFYNLMIYWHT